MTKFFTVEEANTLLPLVRRLVEEMFALRKEALAMRPDVWPVLEIAFGTGGSRKAGERLEVLKKFEEVITQLQGIGCEVQGVE